MNYVQTLKKRYVDGIILASNSQLPEIPGIPLVFVDRAVSIDDFPSVSVDDYEGGKIAAEHLITIGCKNIAHISGPKKLFTSNNRTRGFTDVLKDLSIYRNEYVVEGNFTTESAINSTQELLKRHPEIDGIFAANDLMAVGALKACIRMDRKVPEDVALIGFDGIELCRMIEPELSTIAQPIYKIGELAVKQLVHKIMYRTDFPEKHSNLPVKLIERSSTKKVF
jgi:LacI family transcriptional regulator